MQSFNINLGKTKAELQALTEITDLGGMIYDPGKKIAYEKEWHTIVPTSVIKPEIDSTELDYYYNETKLHKKTNYCAQLYWKAGLIITDGTDTDMANADYFINTKTRHISGGNFNLNSGLVDTIYYTRGIITNPSTATNGYLTKGFAISEELAQLLDTTNIRDTLKKIPGLQQAVPSSGHDYLYNGTQAYTSNTLSTVHGYNIMASSINEYIKCTPITSIFGHDVTGVFGDTGHIKVTDDNDILQLDYNQPENNIDDPKFYNFDTGTLGDNAPEYISKYYPQALPLGVPIVIAPAFVTTRTSISTTAMLKTLVIPFIFYMLGITEVPEEA